jgi:hypothetical protein
MDANGGGGGVGGGGLDGSGPHDAGGDGRKPYVDGLCRCDSRPASTVSSLANEDRTRAGSTPTPTLTRPKRKTVFTAKYDYVARDGTFRPGCVVNHTTHLTKTTDDQNSRRKGSIDSTCVPSSGVANEAGGGGSAAAA